ncbi:kinase-like domain-containing protein, partial [Mycena vulgaris]
MIRDLSVVGDNFLPSSMFIHGVTRCGDHPISGGGFSDVYQALYKGETVALKAIRTFHRGSILRRLRSKLCQEAHIWKHLSHPNILPLIGVDRDSCSPFIGFVSPWMEHGNALQYLKNQGTANVNKLLFDIAEGVNYLHSSNIVHGDLRGSNVLIDEQSRACLTDFGLSFLSDASAGNSPGRVGSLRWMAPELIDPSSFGCSEFSPTQASDVYAFGCVCYELYTSQAPFAGLSDIKAMFTVVGGSRPDRPSSTKPAMADTLWELVVKCWAPNYATRPTMKNIVQDFRMVFQFSGIPPDKNPSAELLPRNPMKQAPYEGTVTLRTPP